MKFELLQFDIFAGNSCDNIEIPVILGNACHQIVHVKQEH